MANMSYYRFRNTLADLKDCENALSDIFLDELQEEERVAALRLITICIRIADNFGDEVED